MALSERYLAVEKRPTVENAVFSAGHNGDNMTANAMALAWPRSTLPCFTSVQFFVRTVENQGGGISADM